MTKTHAKFLEELKEFINKENNKYSPMSIEYCFGGRDAYNNILHKIEQFQAEQKQTKEPDVFDTQKLDEEEQDIEDSLNRGEWVSVKKQVSDEKS